MTAPAQIDTRARSEAQATTPREATARSEALAIRIAASAYDRAVHQHGFLSVQASIAYRDLNVALRAHGIDSTTEAIENTEADLMSEAEQFHSTAALLPDDLRETRQHLQATGGMGNV
jgi:hypothetical protein